MKDVVIHEKAIPYRSLTHRSSGIARTAGKRHLDDAWIGSAGTGSYVVVGRKKGRKDI